MYQDRPKVKARLDDDVVSWLTTVSPGGQPQSSPIWFLATDETIVIYSLAGTPRVRNIRANPRVAFTLNSDRVGDKLVIIEGEAEIIEGGPLAAEDADYLTKYAPHLSDMGMSAEAFSHDYPALIHVRPTRLRGKG